MTNIMNQYNKPREFYNKRNKELAEDYMNGILYDALCEKYNISIRLIHRILTKMGIKKQRKILINTPETFMSKVIKTETCWDWQGETQDFGYGIIRYQNKIYMTHRLSYMLFKGEIPENKIIMHICDRPKCVNPDHLQIGTKKDNNIDCMLKGRRPHGEAVPQAKLKESEALEIKYSNEKNVRLAEKFHIHETQVCNIKKGIKWRHLNQIKIGVMHDK